MKKIIIKEFEKCYLIIDIVFYNIICIIGLVVLTTDGLDLISLIKYFYLLFFVIAFFATLAYFSNRRKGDYEFLLYAFINVYVGTFALVYINYNNPWLILGCSMLVYTIANSLNRGLHVKLLDEENNCAVIVKFAVLVLITLLSLFVAINLLSHSVIGNELMGYYFLGFGLFSLIEPYMTILLRNKKVNDYLLEKNKDKKEVKTVQKREVKKPVKKPVKKTSETTKVKKVVKKK